MGCCVGKFGDFNLVLTHVLATCVGRWQELSQASSSIAGIMTTDEIRMPLAHGADSTRDETNLEPQQLQPSATLWCPILSPRGRYVVYSLFRGQVQPAREHVIALVAEAETTLRSFGTSTLVYVIAKEWADLLSIYVFRLQPRPFCQGEVSVCGTIAPGWQLLCFALGLLAVLTPLQCSANAHIHKLPPVLGANLPVAFSQCVGWALGAASAQFLEELDHYGDSLSACSSCNLLNAVACMGLTLCTAGLMVVVDPIVERLEAGVAAVAAVADSQPSRSSRLQMMVLAFWQLASRGLKYNVMILWTYVGTHTIKWGVSPTEQEQPVFGRLLVTYAISLTTLFAIAVVVLLRWRARIEAMPLPLEPTNTSANLASSSPSTAPSTAPSTCLPTTHPTDNAPALPTSNAEVALDAHLMAAHAPDVDRQWLLKQLGRLELVMLRRAAFVQVLVLVEAAMGWTTGSAWTDAVVFWSPLSDQPSLWVIAKDSLVAIALSVTMLVWLVLVGGEGTRIGTDAKRESVERYFLTNAGSFIVGWGWVVLLRDLSAATARAIDKALGADPEGGAHLAFWSEAATVVVFGPVLSVVLVRGGVWYGSMRRCCGGCCCAPEATIDDAPAEVGAATHSTPSRAVAFEGGGERSRAIGHLIREQRARVAHLAKMAGTTDEEAAAVGVATSAADADSGPRTAPPGSATPTENDRRQALLQPVAPPASSSLADGTSIRASYRQQLLAQIIDSEPLLLGASRPDSRIPSCVPSAVPSRLPSMSQPGSRMPSLSVTHP